MADGVLAQGAENIHLSHQYLIFGGYDPLISYNIFANIFCRLGNTTGACVPGASLVSTRGASTAGRARTPTCTSPSSLGKCAAGREKRTRWKSPGHWPAWPTARTAQMEFNKLPLEVGCKRGFNNTSLYQKVRWLHHVSRKKKGEVVQNLRKKKMEEKATIQRVGRECGRNETYKKKSIIITHPVLKSGRP